MEPADTLELIEICQSLVKLASDQASALIERDKEIGQLRKGAAVSRAAFPIALEKVAAARVPQGEVDSFLDTLIAAGLIHEDTRDKMATTLQDPAEMARAALQIVDLVRPGHHAGVGFNPPSQLPKRASASTNDTDEAEKAAEDREWRQIALTGQT